MREKPISSFDKLKFLAFGIFVVSFSQEISTRSLPMCIFSPSWSNFSISKKVPKFLLCLFLLIYEFPISLLELIQKTFPHRSLIFYSVCVVKISILRFSLCIRISVWEWVESKITRTQLSYGPKWSKILSCNLFYSRTNSLSASADSFLELCNSLAPHKFEIT